MNPDYINGIFEFVGGCLCWMNVRKLYQDKRLVGVYWPVQAFFSGWGMWNLIYYPALSQWASFWGGVFLVSGNATWTFMAMYYTRKIKDEIYT